MKLQRLVMLVGIASFTLAAAPRTLAVCSGAARTWQCWEGSFAVANLGSNPYRDLKVKVEFCPGAACTDPPNPANPSTYAFWDGGSQLKMRMALPSSGIWFWKARCDPGSCSFTQTGQTLNIANYAGSNPLYSNGGLLVSGNGRFLKQTVPLASGAERALVWVGDTTWSGPLRSGAAQWTNFLDDRIAKGFSVLQVALPVDWMQVPNEQPRYVVGGTTQYSFNTEPCGATTPEPHLNPMPRNQSCWNPAFWQAFERKIFEANDKGLVVMVVGLMEGVIEKPLSGNWCPPVLSASRTLARNVAARFAGNFVIFSPGFDRRGGSTVCAGAGDTTARIKDIGGVVAAAAPRSLVTNHWGGGAAGNEILGLQDESWLDFQLFQSGQAVYTAPNASNQLASLSCRARQLALCIWNRSCPFSCPGISEPGPAAPANTKPGINGESIYDGFSHATLGSTNYNALNARRTGYYSMMSGASGYTYGAEGLYNWGVSTLAAVPSTAWGRRSSRHMQYLGSFFRGITFRSLRPDSSLILTPQPAEEHRRMVLARGSAGDFFVAYLPDNPHIKIHLTAFPSLQVDGRWLNPRTGAITPAIGLVLADAPGEIIYPRPLNPPPCPPASTPDPLLTCTGEPTADPCYCVDAANPNRGERDWVLVVP